LGATAFVNPPVGFRIITGNPWPLAADSFIMSWGVFWILDAKGYIIGVLAGVVVVDFPTELYSLFWVDNDTRLPLSEVISTYLFNNLQNESKVI